MRQKERERERERERENVERGGRETAMEAEHQKGSQKTGKKNV